MGLAMSQLKIWLYGIGAVLLSALAFFAKTFKVQRDRARDQVGILKTSAHVEIVKKEIQDMPGFEGTKEALDNLSIFK